MARTRPSTNASGHREAPNTTGSPAEIHDDVPQHETGPPEHPPYDDVADVPQYYYQEGATEEPQPAKPYPPQEPYAAAANADVPHYPPEGGVGPTQPPVQYPPGGGMGQTQPPVQYHAGPTQPPVQYPPEGGMGRTQPPVQYPPESGMGPTQPPVQYHAGPTQHPVQYPPEGGMGRTQPPVQYPPESGMGRNQPPVQYPPPSPLRTPVMGTPVPYPPPGPQQVAMIQQNKGDAAAAAYAANAAGEQWSSELFDCDMSQDYAIATAICPCVTFGQIAEIVDEGQTSCLLAGMLYMVMIPALFTCSVLSSGYRQKIRQKYNLVEAPSDDCSVHLINPCCALCQEYRELQSKGFDPSLGWIANLALAQQQQETAMYPPGNQYMSR